MLHKTPTAELPTRHPLDRARGHPVLPADVAALAKCLGISSGPEFETDVGNAIYGFVNCTIDGMGWRWKTTAEVINDTLTTIAKGPEKALSRIVVAARNKKQRRPSISDLAVMAFIVRTDIRFELVEEYGADAVESVALLVAVKTARTLLRRRRKPGRGNRKDEALTDFVDRLVKAAKNAGAPNMAANWRAKKADQASRRRPPPLVAFVDSALGMALIRMRGVLDHRVDLSDTGRKAICRRIEALDSLDERSVSNRITAVM